MEDNKQELSPEDQAKADALAELQAAADKAPTNSDEAKAQIEAEKEKAEGKAKPEGVPEKFWDAEKGEVRTEELLKSYTELEKSKGESEKESEETSEDKSEEKAEDKAEDKAEEKSDEDILPGKALVEELTQAYTENKEFTEEQYAKAAALGFDKEFVDSYTAGQEALAKEAETRITDAAGGKENMERMYKWASTAMSQAEIDKLNAAFESGDTNTAVLAMEGLRAKHAQATGIGGQLMQGKPAGASVDSFKSQAEVTEAMKNPKYRTDPAYRQAVAEKLARSNFQR